MKLKKFKIQNFKGIEDAEISIDTRANTPIITLIGLNESGKTTILEAISHFVSGDSVVAKIFDEPQNTSGVYSLVPIHKKVNFTGAVSISAIVSLTEGDIQEIQDLAKTQCNCIIDTEPFMTDITITKQYEFADGNPSEDVSRNTWDLQLFTKKTKHTKKYKPYQYSGEGEDLEKIVWNKIIGNLAQISYFPTFLVDFPQRIYITEHETESDANRYYRHVLQDVLDSLNSDLSLEKHIVDRINSFKSKQTPAQLTNWLTLFLNRPEKGQVDSVITQMAEAMSSEILVSWDKIFQRTSPAKSVHIDWFIDTERDDLPYITISISDGKFRYALQERSLGFRWFFSFLLFTSFKQYKKRETIFLFDEPAANLHAGAQTELLKSFEKITEGGHKIIYSTHSHHMINPYWLSGAYIVENKAIDFDDRKSVDALNGGNTDIKTIPYKQFVTKYPNRSSYFQPVLESISYVSPEILPDMPVVITEGISDYYAFSLVSRSKSLLFKFIPGLGAGASGPIISFLIASGRKFIVLLDDDNAGKKEAKNYVDRFHLRKNSVFTLAEIDASFAGKKLETILSAETHRIIREHFLKKGNQASKKEVELYFAEKMYQKQKNGVMSTETRDQMNKIIFFLNDKIEALSAINKS